MLWKFRYLFMGIVLTLVYTLFYASFHVDPHHDGIILKPAIDLYFGKRLFADSFTQYGALTTVIHVAFMKVLGPNLLSIRYSAVVFYCGISALLYIIWRRFLSPGLSFLLIIVWLIMSYFPNVGIMVPFLGWSSVYALFFQLLTTWSIFKFLETNKNLYLISGGCAIALTFWARQPVGVFLALAIFGFFILRGILIKNFVKASYSVGCVLLGLLIACIPFTIWIIGMNAFQFWWEQSILMAFNFGRNLSKSFSILHILSTLFPSVFEQKKNLMFAILPILSIITFISSFIILAVRRSKKDLQIQYTCVVSCIALASWLQYFPGADHSHAFWAVTPMIGFVFTTLPSTVDFFIRHAMSDLGIKNGKTKVISLIGSIGIVSISLLPFISTDIQGFLYYVRTPSVTITSPDVLKGMKAIGEASVFTNVSDHLNRYFATYPDDFALNLSPDALYMLFDPHFMQFHRQTVYWDWATQSVFPDYLPKLRTILQKDKPLILVRDKVIFGQKEDAILFSDYCSIDLSSPTFLRTQILMRPLVMRIPAKRITGFTLDRDGITAEPHIGAVSVTNILQLQGGGIATELLDTSVPATSSASHRIPFALPTKQGIPFVATVYFKSDFAGDCIMEVTSQPKKE